MDIPDLLAAFEWDEAWDMHMIVEPTDALPLPHTPSINCPVCQLPVEEEPPIRNTCGHLWHRECLNNNLRHALQQRANWPAKCCRQTQVEIAVVSGHLDEDVRALWGERGEGYSTPRPTYCHQCFKFIPI